MIGFQFRPFFKYGIILVLGAVGIALFVVQTAETKGPKLAGPMQVFQLAPSAKPRPTTTWKDGNGKAISLAKFKDKVVLVNFWATWCPPCIRELPSIDRLQASLGGDNFTVVAVSIDRGGKPVAMLLVKRLKIKHLTLYLDKESKTARDLGVRSMPTTFIFDRMGREVGKLEGGAEWDDKDAVALVKFFIDNPNYADKLPRKK